jgi:hypothetical protein
MNDLDWLVAHRFQDVTRYEYSWAFAFDDGVGLTTECLWRLIENDRIRLTSMDDGHSFGRPAPADCVLEINQRISGAMCTAIVLHEGTLDLEIRFDSGHAIQILPDSSGYEAWSAHDRSRQFIAVGGGDLVVFADKRTNA